VAVFRLDDSHAPEAAAPVRKATERPVAAVAEKRSKSKDGEDWAQF